MDICWTGHFIMKPIPINEGAFRQQTILWKITENDRQVAIRKDILLLRGNEVESNEK